jgi:demethylmenaquinone methyltransferase / 2-methoxy-6-polyprenyl-1,4-benzoquinol methylase
MTEVKPYAANAGKKEQVEHMFDNIAHSYDFLNRFFSLGTDIRWRNKALRTLNDIAPERLLDVATGTADFALQIAGSRLPVKHITGIDISAGMLDIGRQKVAKKQWGDKIELIKADSENLPFESGRFDAVTVAFGVRNFEHLEKGLAEMLRVLRPGGKAVVLEFSKPRKFPMKQLFGFYFRFIMPGIGRLVSKDKRAYEYLPESVAAFPEGQDFADILSRVGYRDIRIKALSGGIASIYTATKPGE